MKNYITIVILFVCALSFGQVKVDALDFQGKVTSTVRDGMTVPTNNARLIWNSTTERFEYAQDDEVWVPLVSGSAADLNDSLWVVNPNGDFEDFEITTPLGVNALQFHPDFTNLSGGAWALVLENDKAVIGSGSTFYDFDGTYNSNDDVPRKSDIDAALASAGTDDQTLSLGGSSNTDLSISDGNTITLPVIGNANQVLTGNRSIDVNGNDFFIKNDETEYLFIGPTARELIGTWSIPYTNTTSGLTATDVQAAIDELATKDIELTSNISQNATNISENTQQIDSIATVLATPAVSQFVFVTQTVADTAIVADARDNRIVFLDYDNENFTIPADVFETGNAIRIQSIGTGTARIVPADGVSFAPWDGFQLDSIGKAITLARVNFDTAPEDWLPIDGYIKNYIDILPAPLADNANPELITTALAFTPLDIATSPGTGINNNSITTVLNPTWSVVDAAANDYGVEKAIRVTATTSANDRINYWLTGVTIGATYDVAILHRNHDGNGTSRIRMVSAESNVLFDYQTGGTDWVLGVSTFTPTATQVRFEMYGNFGGATPAGSADYIVSVKLQD